MDFHWFVHPVQAIIDDNNDRNHVASDKKNVVDSKDAPSTKS